MTEGWDATGLIEPVWKQLRGKKTRDHLAELSGVRGTELSLHNNGKRLGPSVARKIIEGAKRGGVAITIFDLGATEEAAETRVEVRVVDRLRQAEEELAHLRQFVAEIADGVAVRPAARPTVRALEAPQPSRQASDDPRQARE